MSKTLLKLENLTMKFGGVTALDEVNLEIKEGEILALIGPNGAGKSTTIMILTTLLKPTSGQALVSGFDVMTQPKQVRQSIGYVQQESTVDEYLTGRENLLFFNSRCRRACLHD
jgi:ABC-2 type transport system ATP-binding protein